MPQVVPGFPAARTCTPGQLLYRQIGLGRTTNIIYHNGHMYTNNVGGGDRREWVFTNPNDPASLSIVPGAPVPFMSDQGNHAHTKSGDYAAFNFRRVSPGVNANTDQQPGQFYQVQQPPVGGDIHRIYYPWGMPFNWAQYGSTTGSARLWRGNQMLSEWQPLADNGVVGNTIMVGNLLFIVSDGSMLGVLAYDIAPVFENPSRPPRLLDKFTGPVGAYLPSIWQNYIVLSNENDLYVIDYSDPTDLKLVSTVNLTGTPAFNAGTNVPYLQTQDQYVFTRRHKVDMDSLRPVLEFDEVGNGRPAGSVTGQLDISQYMMPLGQYVITGSYSFPGRDGVGVWCHQATPDTRAPYVGYHVPRPGQTNYPVGAPVSLLIAETLESYTIINGTTITLRPRGGAPVDAWTSFSHDHVLTLTPKQYLTPNTTYDVVIPAGGIKDASGNGIEAYSFSFSTGGSVSGGNGAPTITTFTASAGPVLPNQSITFAASATDPEGDVLEYRFSFGDGTPATSWSPTTTAAHAFALAGHFQVKVQVRDRKPDGSTSTVSDTLVVSAASAPTGPQPAYSAQLGLDATNRVVWVVNPDSDSVTRLGADTRQVQQEVNLRALLGVSRSVHPSAVTVAPNGEAWVTLRDLDRVVVLSANGALLANIDTGYGSAPQAAAVTRDGSRVFVTLGGRGATDGTNGQLVRYATSTRTETGRVELGPTARALAVTGDGARVFVARFISRENYGEIWEVNGNTMALTRTIPLYRDRGNLFLDNGGTDGPGVPNYISSLTISPQQDWLWYTAIKADTNRGLFFKLDTNNNLPFNHDSTVRSLLGRIELNRPNGVPQEPGMGNFSADGRIDVDNSDSPSSLVFSPRGDYAFATLQGNDAVAVFDDLAIREGGGRSSTWRLDVGAAPQGTLWDPATNMLWVKNLMSRNVTVYPMGEFLASGDRGATPITVRTVSNELLSPNVLAGKRSFYLAGSAIDGQNKMSFEGYISCASCHLDGGHDGRTWDFTQRGEGMRNTTTLHGRAGTRQGNVHWTGNFDEIQDFILDIVGQFRGRGFLPPGQTANPSLGAPNAGRSVELDQLAAYVTSLANESLPKSPYRAANGQMTAAANAGAAVFSSAQCVTCHRPASGFTDSTVGTATLHDVGTLRTSSGQRLGQTLTGIDTPTVLGSWATAPYFHDGSAQKIDDVFTVAGGTVIQSETGTRLGGAAPPDFPTINEDSAFHGNMINLGAVGAGVTHTGVDGGPGGLGAIELRYWPGSPGSFRITVNGTHVRTFPFTAETTHFEWMRARLEDVPLNPGASNTITIELATLNSWRGIGLDDMTVTTAATRTQAQPHRGALGLSATDLTNLKAYLLQLDGRDAQGVVVPD